MNNDHFKGKYEVELKFRLQSKDEFLQILATVPHEIMLQDNIEHDEYFDTPEQTLKSQHKSLIIREMQPSAIKLWIVKGPEADGCQATNIDDVQIAKEMLTTMGYKVFLNARKIRSIFFVGQFHITLDQLDGIGDFAEFAIMTDDQSMLAHYKHELSQLAKRFNLSSEDLEHQSYRTLLTQYAKSMS